MSSKTMWFGTLYNSGASGGPGTSSTSAIAKMSLLPAYDPDVDMGSDGWSETINSYYGGADVVSSAQSHRVYEMAWAARESKGDAALDVIKRYSTGAFGRGLVYFADPYNYDANLFPPHWAEPGLIEQGWRNIYDVDPSFATTASNSYEQPIRTATWNITSTAGAVPTDKRGFAVIPIPPDHTLHLGVSGSATGTAVVRVRPINPDGSYATVTDLTLLTATASTRLNATFAGSSYKAVEVYFTRTTADASTLTVTSMMAQLWRTAGAGPTLTGSFIPGQGNTGCKFESPSIPESYRFVDPRTQRHIKGIAATLVEVGTSKRYA